MNFCNWRYDRNVFRNSLNPMPSSIYTYTQIHVDNPYRVDILVKRIKSIHIARARCTYLKQKKQQQPLRFHSFAFEFAFFCTNIFNMLIKLMLVNLHVCSWKFVGIVRNLWNANVYSLFYGYFSLYLSLSLIASYVLNSHIFDACISRVHKINVSKMPTKTT